MSCFGPAEAEDPEGTPNERRRLSQLTTAEQALRRRIEGRMQANAEHGPQLGLTRLVKEHDLSETEQTILILCSMSCIGIDAGESLSACGGFSFSVCGVTVQICAEYLGLDVAGKIAFRSVISDDCRLVRAGLIELEDHSAEPHAFPTIGLILTDKAWRVIAGLPRVEQESKGTKVTP